MLTASSLISAQAAIFEYSIIFGPEAVGATGSGTGSAFYDDVAHTLQLQATYSGLSGTVTATHIHGPTASPGTGGAGIMVGNPNLPNFTFGASSGTYSQTLDLTQSSIYNTTFFNNNGGTAATAETAFINAVNEGRGYWNIHSSTFGGGEIRGFLTLVPEPSSFALAGLGLAALAGWARSRQRTVNS